MAKTAAGLLGLLLAVHLSGADHVIAAENQENVAKETSVIDRNVNPATKFISQLGGLIMDVDEAVWKQTEPLRRLEERFVDQTFNGAVKPPSEYISRIRDNYRDLQKKLGNTLLQNPLGLSPGEAGSKDGVQHSNPAVGVGMPFLPMRRSDANLGSERSGGQSEEVSGQDPRPGNAESLENVFSRLSIPDFNGKFSVGGTMVRLHGKDTGASFHVQREDIQSNPPVGANLQKRFGEIEDYNGEDDSENHDFEDSEVEMNSFENLLMDSEERERPVDADVDGYSRMRRSQAPEYEVLFNMSPNFGRLAGGNLADGLYSEMVTDKKLRRILKNHAVKFVLDPSLDPGKTIIRKLKSHGILPQDSDTLNERPDFGRPKTSGRFGESPEEFEVRRRRGWRGQLTRNDIEGRFDDYDSPDISSSSYYDMVNIDGIRRELGRYGLDHETPSADSYDPHRFGQDYQNVILAFTPEGLPVQLGLDQDIENPLKYLRRTLYEAGVYVNVPVDSRRVPVGREVLQVGATDGSWTSPLYVDLSDDRQLRAFLSSLRRSQDRDYGSYGDDSVNMDSYY